MRKPTECSLIIGTGYWVYVFSLILGSSVGLWVGIQVWWRIGVSDFQGPNPAEEDHFSPFDSKIACLCQSINIKHNKHACMYTTGYWVQVFSLFLGSSVSLSVGIQSFGDSVPETLGSNPAFSRGRQLLVSIRFNITSLLSVGSSGLNARWS